VEVPENQSTQTSLSGVSALGSIALPFGRSGTGVHFRSSPTCRRAFSAQLGVSQMSQGLGHRGLGQTLRAALLSSLAKVEAQISDRTKAGMASRPNHGDACPGGQSSRCRTVSVCRTVKACQFAEGDIGEPHWVALSLIDMSEDYQCHGPAHIIVVIHRCNITPPSTMRNPTGN